MKITGVVRSAEEITGVKGLKSFEGERDGKYFNYTESMNDMAGQRIVLEEYKGSHGYDYLEIRDSCQSAVWQASWLNGIQHETDWSKVPVDAKVKIKITGAKRYFAVYDNNKIYLYDYGQTSWSYSDMGGITPWQPDEVELVR